MGVITVSTIRFLATVFGFIVVMIGFASCMIPLIRNKGTDKETPISKPRNLLRPSAHYYSQQTLHFNLATSFNPPLLFFLPVVSKPRTERGHDTVDAARQQEFIQVPLGSRSTMRQEDYAKRTWKSHRMAEIDIGGL